jgi:hypothetical protein
VEPRPAPLGLPGALRPPAEPLPAGRAPLRVEGAPPVVDKAADAKSLRGARLGALLVLVAVPVPVPVAVAVAVAVAAVVVGAVAVAVADVRAVAMAVAVAALAARRAALVPVRAMRRARRGRRLGRARAAALLAVRVVVPAAARLAAVAVAAGAARLVRGGGARRGDGAAVLALCVEVRHDAVHAAAKHSLQVDLWGAGGRKGRARTGRVETPGFEVDRARRRREAGGAAGARIGRGRRAPRRGSHLAVLARHDRRQGVERRHDRPQLRDAVAVGAARREVGLVEEHKVGALNLCVCGGGGSCVLQVSFKGVGWLRGKKPTDAAVPVFRPRPPEPLAASQAPPLSPPPTCSTRRSTTGRMLPPSPSSGRDATGSLGGARAAARASGRRPRTRSSPPAALLPFAAQSLSTAGAAGWNHLNSPSPQPQPGPTCSRSPG